MGYKGKGRASNEQNRPKRRQSIVWALGKRFFNTLYGFFLYQLMFYCLYIENTGLEGKEGSVMVKTGPNDARHVVWALGKLFFY